MQTIRLKSPHSYYTYYHQRAGLENVQKGVPAKSSHSEKLNRIVELYKTIAAQIVSDLRPQFTHDEEGLKKVEHNLNIHIANKLKMSESGYQELTVNGAHRFDRTNQAYEEFFQSGKLPFAKIVKEIASELISVVRENPTEDPGKSSIMGPANLLKQPEKMTIAVDLDNTIIDGEENLIPGAKEALSALSQQYRIAIYTARFSCIEKEEWQSMVDYIEALLTYLGVPFDEVSISKPVSKLYIDDRGVRFTNWKDILSLLQTSEHAATATAGTGPQDKTKDKEPSPGVGMMEEVQLETEVAQEALPKSFRLLKI